MQNQSSQVTAQVLLQLKDVAMHRFINNKKSLFTTGNCKIAKIDHKNNSTVYFINMNSFYYTLRKDITFIKLVYDNSISYLFPHFQSGLSTLSIAKQSQFINNLQQILSNASSLIDYPTAMTNENLKNKIELHCPNIQKQAVLNLDNIKQAINTTGKLLNTAFTYLGGFMKQGVSIAGEFINNKIQAGENKQVNPQTKQKWQNIKKGTTNIFNLSLQTYNTYVNPIIKPVIQKGISQIGNIKQKIQTSENQNVKYAKQLAQTSSKALSEAFDGLLKGSIQVGGQLSNQTKKIVSKKLGDDYVKTFIENQQQQNKQHQQNKQLLKQSQTETPIHKPEQVDLQENKSNQHFNNKSTEYPSLD